MDRSSVIRFVPNVFVRFAGFEGEYYVYLTEKRVKRAETGGAKMMAGLLSNAPMSLYEILSLVIAFISAICAVWSAYTAWKSRREDRK